MMVNPQNPDDVFVSNSSFHRSHGRRPDVQRQRRRSIRSRGRRLRRLPRHLDRSEGSRSLRPDRRRRARASTRRPGHHCACRCRSGRCITSPWTTACRTGSTATGRTTGRCAGRATRSEQTGNGRAAGGQLMPLPRGPVAGAAGADRRTRRRRRTAAGGGGCRRWNRGGATPARQWQPDIGGCESGFTIPDPDDAEHRLGDLLRQQGHALGRAHGHRAIGRAVDDHARLAAERSEVPLPLDGAARDRSVRSQHRLYGCQLIFKTTNGGQSWT